MTFKTQSELIATSTGLFYDNTVGAITPSGFRQMNENLSDSMIPYDSSGVFQISTVATGNVPTPTATGAMVLNTSTSTLHIYNGTWLTFSTGGE
jgi:hypothetical protein